MHIVKSMREDGINDLRDIENDGYECIADWKPELVSKLSKNDLLKAELLLQGGDTIYLPYFLE